MFELYVARNREAGDRCLVMALCVFNRRAVGRILIAPSFQHSDNYLVKLRFYL